MNGTPTTLPDQVTSIQALLTHLDLDGRPVAIAKNGEIVPRGEHDQIYIKAGDAIEIVHAVGGG